MRTETNTDERGGRPQRPAPVLQGGGGLQRRLGASAKVGSNRKGGVETQRKVGCKRKDEILL